MSDDDPLVRYEYAQKAPKRAAANFRWQVCRDGRYLVQQNATGATRPADIADPYWFDAPWREQTRLDTAQLAAIDAIARDPQVEPGRRSGGGHPDGSWARLTLADGRQVEVEDEASPDIEAVAARIPQVLMPGAPAGRRA